jgi:hypothetical protein
MHNRYPQSLSSLDENHRRLILQNSNTEAARLERAVFELVLPVPPDVGPDSSIKTALSIGHITVT